MVQRAVQVEGQLGDLPGRDQRRDGDEAAVASACGC